MRLVSLAMGALCAAGAVSAEDKVPARLAGHAVIPALTLIVPPADAPRDALVSGKFTGAARNDAPMSVPGNTGPTQGNRLTGVALPMIGQPFQGLSGLAMNRAPNGGFYVLTDNGFGAKNNSSDALLSFHRLAPDFATGKVVIHDTVFLSDPDRVVPFRIAYEASDERYLTGADFDPESIQVIGDTIWIGDEFGPYLLSATLNGKITGVYDTLVDGEVVRSPDNAALRIPAEAGTDYRAQRSGGFEGMGLNPETGNLWGLIEKPLLGADGEPEGDFLRLVEFDPAAAQWTGNSRRFPLGTGAVAIGDMNFIDGSRALVIERDNGEGDPSLACAEGAEPEAGCFPTPARVKRVVAVDFAGGEAGGMVARVASVDLMDIGDPDGMARVATDAAAPLGQRFTFPFVTIENVVRIDAEHILVINDNNLPFSAGRSLDKADGNEFMLLSVPELLAATSN